METQQLSLEQQFAIAKMNRTIQGLPRRELMDLVRQLFVQVLNKTNENSQLINELKLMYMEILDDQ
ncbi:MAG: hypothetical protein AAGA60_15815 [Cyanobacteria bacterium P01_E01_bin.42]